MTYFPSLYSQNKYEDDMLMVRNNYSGSRLKNKPSAIDGEIRILYICLMFFLIILCRKTVNALQINHSAYRTKLYQYFIPCNFKLIIITFCLEINT